MKMSLKLSEWKKSLKGRDKRQKRSLSGNQTLGSGGNMVAKTEIYRSSCRATSGVELEAWFEPRTGNLTQLRHRQDWQLDVSIQGRPQRHIQAGEDGGGVISGPMGGGGF